MKCGLEAWLQDSCFSLVVIVDEVSHILRITFHPLCVGTMHLLKGVLYSELTDKSYDG